MQNSGYDWIHDTLTPLSWLPKIFDYDNKIIEYSCTAVSGTVPDAAVFYFAGKERPNEKGLIPSKILLDFCTLFFEKHV